MPRFYRHYLLKIGKSYYYSSILLRSVYTIMSKPQKITKNVNGNVYYYERTPYYDPILKNTKEL